MLVLVLLPLYFCPQRKDCTNYFGLYTLLNNLPLCTSVFGGPISPGPMAPIVDKQLDCERRKSPTFCTTCLTYVTSNTLN